MGGEKQLWLSVLLKDTNVTAGIRTHILLLTPELESGKLDRLATTLQRKKVIDYFDKITITQSIQILSPCN